MGKKVNLNSDMGEGFGDWDIGNDTALLTIINSANVACGFHAGDPNVMHRVIDGAKANGVSIGAHPGFNDLWGFGRRRITMPPRDVENMVAYQIGGLQGMAAAQGMKVTHVKPHGALNNMACEDEDLADALARATKAVDPELIFLAPTGSLLLKAGEKHNLPLASELFADRTYDDNGNLTPRSQPNAMVHDADEAVANVIHMVEHQEVISTSGKHIPIKVDSICVHGDGPTAVDVAQKVKSGLTDAGITLAPLPDFI